MDENQIQASPLTPEPSLTETSESRQILLEVLENSRKTKNYMKWQLYITLILVVLPLLAAVFLVPMMIGNLADLYGASGLLQ